MTFFWIWALLEMPCLMWFTHFWFDSDREAKSWIVFPVSVIIAVPMCIIMIFFGTIFNVLNWANNGR